ncbi:MAG: hypothetical protein ACN6N7_17190 [Chryseobacterium culicis]
MNIPTPKNWEDFESICLSSFKIRWNSPNLVKNGRQGQAQHGVDIFGEDNLGNQVGIQCKKYDGTLTIKTVEEEIEKATKFEPPITSFYIATTAPTDATIQREIRILSDQRKKDGEFSVRIFSWDEIIQELIINKAIFKKHYPEFDLQDINNPKKTIALFDLAYRGLGFRINFDLIVGEMSEDIRQILTICTMIESAARKIMAEKELEDLLSEINTVKGYVHSWLTGNSITQEQILLIQAIGDQIVHKINAIQYDLNEYDLATFRLGAQIVNWDNLQNKGKLFDEAPILEILGILFNNVPTDLLELIDSWKKEESVSIAHYPHNFFILCRRHFIRMLFPE